MRIAQGKGASVRPEFIREGTVLYWQVQSLRQSWLWVNEAVSTPPIYQLRRMEAVVVWL